MRLLSSWQLDKAYRRLQPLPVAEVAPLEEGAMKAAWDLAPLCNTSDRRAISLNVTHLVAGVTIPPLEVTLSRVILSVDTIMGK